MPTPATRRQFVKMFPTPRVEDTLFFELVDKSRKEIPAYGTPHPDTALYPNHFFCFLEPAVDESGDWNRWWYIAGRSLQDTYNWESVKADIGGQKFDAVTRSYVTLRSVYSDTTPAMGAAMPNTPTGLFTGTYVLAQRREVRSNDPKIDSLFVIDERTYVKKTTIKTLGFDDVCKRVLSESETLYYATETVGSTGLTASALIDAPTNSYWGLQSDGVVREGRQISAGWYAITERQAMAGTFTLGVLEVDSYTGNIDYTWPPVIQFVEFMDWERRDGGIDIHPRVVFKRERYTGPCACETTVTWSKTKFTIAAADTVLPNGGHYGSPFFNVSLPDCLHGNLAFQCNIGNTDPDYKQNVGSMRILLATNETDWPSELTIEDDQRPFRGGYLRTVRKVYPPSATGGGAVVIVVPAPTGLASSNVADTTFDLDWDADAEATDYLVEVATDAGFTEHVVYRTVQTNSDSITGMTAETAYHARVTTLRGYMFSPPCAAITVTTTA